MDILLQHPFPVAALLLCSLLAYAAEFILKRRVDKTQKKWRVLLVLISVFAFLSNFALLFFVLSVGGGIEEVLAVLLLSLLGALM